MSTVKETVFIDRDNSIRLILSEEGTLFADKYPGITPTRWVFTINTTVPIVVDSTVTPSAFTWDGVHSIIEIHLGALVTTAVGYTTATLVIYSPIWPDGVVWINPTCTPDKLLVRICDNS